MADGSRRMSEPTLASVRTEVLGALELDKRVRAVEITTAAQAESVKNLEAYLPRMEDRLIAAIDAAKPKVWQAAAVLVSGAGVLAAVFIAVVTGR